MPKKIDPEVRERALRLLQTHGGEYASLTAAAEAVAKQVGVGKELNRPGSGGDRDLTRRIRIWEHHGSSTRRPVSGR